MLAELLWIPQSDPNLFHLNWERTAEALTAIVVLSLLVERFLAIIFDSRWFINVLDGAHIQELIALIFAATVCIVWDFDAVGMIILADETNWFGCFITGGVVAGGSKASVKLFRDVLGFKSTARQLKEKGKIGAGAKP